MCIYTVINVRPIKMQYNSLLNYNFPHLPITDFINSTTFFLIWVFHRLPSSYSRCFLLCEFLLKCSFFIYGLLAFDRTRDGALVQRMKLSDLQKTSNSESRCSCPRSAPTPLRSRTLPWVSARVAKPHSPEWGPKVPSR